MTACCRRHDGVTRFLVHTKAMCTIIARQRLQRRAIIAQFLRACTPCGFLALLWWRASFVKDKKRQAQEYDFLEMEDTFLDFSVIATTLATVMMGLSFFVSQLALERKTGLRHLLHVSGLCRYSFWLATVSLEGVLQGLAEVAIILIFGGLLLRIQLILEGSLTLLLIATALTTISAVLVGCMVFMIFGGQRASSIVATTLAIFITIGSSVYCTVSPMVPAERLPIFVLVCPVFPAYHALWTLASSCSLTGGGRCMQFGDVWEQGPLFSPLEMALGTSRHAEVRPGGGFLSLVGLVLLQHALLWPLVLLLDTLHHRPLRRQAGEPAPEGEVASVAGPGPRTMLEIRRLVHWYSWLGPLMPESGQVRTLDGVSFTIQDGGMLGLLGPNGAGKTTIVRCVTGEERPRAGSVLLGRRGNGGGAAPGSPRLAEDGDQGDPEYVEPSAALLGSGGGSSAGHGGSAYLGLCPQESSLHEGLTVEDHLWFFATIRRCGRTAQVVQDSLRAIKLEDKRHVVPGELSGGMRRRLAVGCSMVGFPALALLDEPTTGLDPVARREIWSSSLAARDAGTACLLTTHMLEEAEELCTHIVILTKGRIAAEGTVQQLKELWSTGYTLHLDAKAEEQAAAKAYVASLLPVECKEPMKSSLHGQMIFSVGRDAEFVGNLFLELARNAEGHGVRRWGISQASLEDAYMRIVAG